MTDKSRSGSSERTIPQTPDSSLFYPFSKQLQTARGAIGLLRRLERVDRCQDHSETRRSDRSRDGLDQYGPSESRKQSKNKRVGSSVAETGEWSLKPSMSMSSATR